MQAIIRTTRPSGPEAGHLYHNVDLGTYIAVPKFDPHTAMHLRASGCNVMLISLEDGRHISNGFGHFNNPWQDLGMIEVR